MLLFVQPLILTILSIFSTSDDLVLEEAHRLTPPLGKVHKNLMLTSFSWSDCGSGSESIHVKSLSVSPDPIAIPGLLSLGFNITNAKDLSSPVSLSTIVKKKVFGVWIKIPCEDNVGSCDYDDACSVIPPTCPESFIKYKIPCKCPIKSGSFIMPLSPVINITGAGIPKWLEGGSYEVKATLKDKSGTEVACVDVQAKLKAN